MNSRQRILGAIYQQPVDRVPVSTLDMVPWKPDIFQAKDPSYQRMMEYFRNNTDCVYYTHADYIPSVPGTFEFREWREGNQAFMENIIHAPGKDLVCRKKKIDGIETWWTLEHYCRDLSDMEKYLSILDHKAGVADIGKVHQIQKDLADRGVICVSLADPIGEAAWILEMGSFLVYAITETDRILGFLDALFEVQMHHLRQILKQDVRDILFRICGPEYATIPYLSPDLFRSFVTRYLLIMCKEIRDAGGIPWIHCHGKIRRALPEFLETDMMILEPIEPPPDGDIALWEVKKICGDRVCLMGNIELKELEHASPSRIRELVKQAMEEAKGKTGFVLTTTACPIHTPLSPQTEENYICMVETALEFGRY